MVRSSVFFKNMFDLTIMTRLKLSDEIKLIWRKAMKLLIVNMKCGG